MVGWPARLALVATIFAVGASARAETPAPERWKPLRSPAASATSFLQNDWNRYQENYHPSYVLDENPATAWVEGVEAYGENQSLTLPLSPLSSARALRLRIWNGYQKSKDLFAKNSMPRRVRVTVLDAAGAEVVSREQELQRAWGAQTVVVDLPPRRGLNAVRLTILGVYPGTKYKDTCVSDVLVDVDSEVPHNAAAENGKRAALRAWVASRAATARYFAAKPAEFPFAFTHFAAKSGTIALAELERRLGEAEALRKELGPTRFKPVIKKRIQAAPDGLSVDLLGTLNLLTIYDFLELFSLPAVSLFETSDELASHKTSDEGAVETWTTSARVARSPTAPDRIRLLAFNEKEVVKERTTSTSNHELLLVYDDQGRLQRVYREIRDTPDYDYKWVRVSQIFSFSYDAAGKVERIELLLRKSALDYDNKKERDRVATRIVFSGVKEEPGQ